MNFSRSADNREKSEEMPNKIKRVYMQLPEIREVVQDFRAQRKIIGRSVTPKSPVFYEIIERVTSASYAKRLKVFHDQGRKQTFGSCHRNNRRDLKMFAVYITKVVKESFVEAGKNIEKSSSLLLDARAWIYEFKTRSGKWIFLIMKTRWVDSGRPNKVCGW